MSRLADLRLAALRSELTALVGGIDAVVRHRAPRLPTFLRAYNEGWVHGRLQRSLIEADMLNQEYIAWLHRQRVTADAVYAMLEPAFTDSRFMRMVDSRRRKLPRTSRRSVSAQSLWGPTDAHREIAASRSLRRLHRCLRPAFVVREVAKASEPLLASVQRSTKALQQQFAAQRKDLALSKADYEALRIEPARVVSLTDTIWQDLGRNPERAQLAAARRFNQDTRTDPYAALTKGAAPLAVSPVATPDLAGLIEAARALDRMKQDRAMSFGEITEFAKSVKEELQKLEDEAKEAQKGKADE